MAESITDKEAYEHCMFNLLQWLHVMTLQPVELCNAWGNYNVAWELVNDLKTDGNCTITMPCSSLTGGQKKMVEDFLDSLNKIPKALLVSATSVSANQEAMSHPCWLPYRESAAALLLELEAVASRNKEYFYPNQP